MPRTLVAAWAEHQENLARDGRQPLTRDEPSPAFIAGATSALRCLAERIDVGIATRLAMSELAEECYRLMRRVSRDA